MPVIVLFYKDNGLSMTQIMILQAGYSLSTALIEIPTGYFADVWGRKNTLIIGAFLTFAGWLFYCFSYGFWPLLCAEIILGFGHSFVSGTDSALLYDSLLALEKDDHYTRYEGRLSSFGNFAEALAGILGGYLAFISLRMPVYFQAAAAFMAIPAAFLVTNPPRTIIRKASLKDVFKIVHETLIINRLLRLRIAYSSIIGAATLTMAWLVQPLFIHIHLPMKIMNGAINLYSILWTLLNLSVGIMAVYAYKIEKAAGEKKINLVILIFIFSGFIGAALFHSYLAIVFVFLFYCARGIATPVLKDYINRITSSDVRATVLSIRNLIIRVIFSTLGPFIGWLMDAWTLPTGMIAAGILYGIAALTVALKIRNSALTDKTVANSGK